MWEGVAIIVFGLLAAVAGPFVQDRIAAHKRRNVESGVPIRLQVRARGAAPFPRRGAYGVVDTGERPLRWRRWHRLGRPVPITGMKIVGRRVGEVPYSAVEFVFFRLRTGAGEIVELGVAAPQADVFHRVLRDAAGIPPTFGAAGPARRPLPRRRLAAAGLGLAWLAAWLYLATAGTFLPATVLENDDEYCHVEWVLAGRQDAWVDCFSERPGDTVRIVALPAPFEGEAVDVAVTRIVVPVVAAPFFLPLALHGVGRLRARRRPPAPPPEEGTGIGEVEVEKLDRHELRYSRIAETLTRRAEVEEWDVAAVPWWLRAVGRPDRRLVVSAIPGVVLAPAFLLGMTWLAGWTPVTTALRHDAAAAREVTAKVEQVDGFVPPIPWDVLVSFEHEGRTREARVASLRDADEGDELTVRYDAGSGTARLPGEADGVPRGTLVAAIGTTVALAVLLWRATRLAGVLREFRRLRRRPAAPMRYAMLVDPMGAPALLLFEPDGDPRPEVVVGFPELPAGMPVTGAVGVRGTPADGELLVVELGDRVLYPSGVAVALGTADLRDAVNGDLIELSGEGEEG